MSLSESTQVESSLAELFTRETALGEALQAEADAEYAYKIREAKEFLEAEGTIDAKKATAKLKSKMEYERYLKATAVKEFMQCKWKDALQALSARQSILSASARSDQSYANDRRTT